MSYLGGHAIFWLEGDVTGTWLDRRARHRPQREPLSGLPTGPSEETLREIARMDHEAAAKLARRRTEPRSLTGRSKKPFAGRSA